MAEETKNDAAQEINPRSMNLLIVGSFVIFVVLTVVVIIGFQKVTAKMEAMTNALTTLQSSMSSTVDGIQVVEGDINDMNVAGDEAERVVKYTLLRRPEMPLEDPLLDSPMAN